MKGTILKTNIYEKAMKLFLLSILPILISSCVAKSDYPDLAYGLVNDYSKEVKKKYGFSVHGKGGCMINAVQSIFINYSSNRKVNVNEARELFVDIDENLISKFNKDYQIRPFLGNYPFTYNNIELRLSFFDSSGRDYEEGYIVYVSIINGIIRYNIHDPALENKNPLVTIYEEPYEEALRIVHESRNQSTAVPEQ